MRAPAMRGLYLQHLAALQRWHDQHPGATARAFLRANPSSYVWLAAQTNPGDRVLDLACGVGALLDLLRKRGIDNPVGIDMSDGELAVARRCQWCIMRPLRTS